MIILLLALKLILASGMFSIVFLIDLENKSQYLLIF